MKERTVISPWWFYAAYLFKTIIFKHAFLDKVQGLNPLVYVFKKMLWGVGISGPWPYSVTQAALECANATHAGLGNSHTLGLHV